MQFQGGCRCGAIHYQCDAEPFITFYSHCLDCQKSTGAPFSVDVIVAKDAVSITSQPASYTATTNTNDSVKRYFSTECGAPVFNKPRRFPDIIALKASSLDEPGWLKPEAQLWTSRKQPWLVINDGLPQYEGNME